MPCRSSFWRSGPAGEVPATLPAPTSAPVVKDWREVRRSYLHGLRKQTRIVIIILALREVLRIGADQMIWAGKPGYPAPGKDDYGIAYTVGYLICYIYICAFTVTLGPLFYLFFFWWVPDTTLSDPENPSTTERISKSVKNFELSILPFFAVLNGLLYIGYLVKLFIYVDSQVVGSRQLPKNNRKNWIARLLLLCGIAVSLIAGYGAVQIWTALDLVHIKTYEYAFIVVPIQINIGVMIGSKMQMKMEKRVAMEAIKKTSGEEQALLDTDEKTAVIEV